MNSLKHKNHKLNFSKTGSQAESWANKTSPTMKQTHLEGPFQTLWVDLDQKLKLRTKKLSINMKVSYQNSKTRILLFSSSPEVIPSSWII